MNKILFSWIGKNDLESSTSCTNFFGPIASVVCSDDFSHVVLLNNYPLESLPVKSFAELLKQSCESEVSLRNVPLDNPTNFSDIYKICRSCVESIIPDSASSIIPIFHLSSGTPAMAAVWILLSKSNYPKARLVQSSRENGVEYVEMPFDIAAEFIPSKSKDDVRIAALANSAAHDPAFEEIVYRCPSMQKLVNRAQLAATRDVPVLIEGETGTGKELLARAIHNKSSRANAPFVAVNCGAIPRELFEAEIFGYKKGAFTGADAEHVGYFEQGNGGTIFLDELGELPIEGQVKILRVLNDQKIRRLGETKERAINVRIIAATNRSLISEMAAGRFRSDLFYRLAVAVFTLPPLRKREGDLSLLIDSMLQKINHELSQGGGHEDKEFSVSAKNILINHPWPGNAREMFNTITRICVWSTEKKISAEDVTNALLPIEMNNKRDILEKELDDHFNLQETLDFIASHYIERAMDKTHRNKTQAADVLGMSNYQTLNNWIKRLGLDL